MSDFEKTLHAAGKTIDDRINNLLSSDPSEITMAMLYSSLAPGKKIRPFLFLETSKLLGLEQSEDLLNIAAAIEFVHVYSLIHDDLPAMDNSDIRRNQPSCHKKFDEATAILAGDALLTYSFEVIASTKLPANIKCKLIIELSKAAGHRGMIKGQVLDIGYKGKVASVDKMHELHELKTGKLLQHCCLAAGIIAQYEDSAIANFGQNLGLLYQIIDDIEDADQLDECNIVHLLGLEKSKVLAQQTLQKCLDLIQPFGEKANTLTQLLYFISKRAI